jgi:succinoglycan biosynthesis protein ExoO
MTGGRPVVSVITANFDGAAHLPAAIGSVLNQTLGALELIIVDDASSDDSAVIAAAAAEKDSRVRLLVQDRNAGPGAARNRAIAAARGRFVAILDSDDLMAPDRLHRLVARAEADDADMVADNLLAFDDGADVQSGQPFLDPKWFVEPRWISLAEVIGSSRMYARRPGLGYLKPLIRTASLKASGVRYDERLRIGEDYDFLLRLLAKGRRLRLEPDAGYRYRRHVASTSHMMAEDHVRGMLAADAAFETDFPNLPVDVRRAQAARRRSLERALAYGEIIRRLKAGDFGGGLARSLGEPGVWPLLTLPVQARLRRLAQRLQPA